MSSSFWTAIPGLSLEVRTRAGIFLQSFLEEAPGLGFPTPLESDGGREHWKHKRTDIRWAVQMEDTPQIIIPTLSKARISRHLSYPVGAEHISAALASAVQLPELKLRFYSGFDIGLRRGHYEFLRVEYLNNAVPAQSWPISILYKRPPQHRWEIVVQPVPRVFRHRIKQHILDSALTQILSWLNERAGLSQVGSDILAFFFDEKTEEFEPRTLSQLEPFRLRANSAD
jgi:hypothetical protein